jgi:adenosylcobinamide-phosphate synthase
MIPLSVEIIAAVLLDLLIGDPQWFPHPVRLVGRYALLQEKLWTRIIGGKRLSGIAVWIFTVGTTGAVVWLVLVGAGAIHPLVRDLVSILVLYFTFAIKDLTLHGRWIKQALEQDSLEVARTKLSLIVSRDTGDLDREGIIRSTVESLSENTSDGITAPLFFAVLGGPILVMIYKAVSTLDSMFGYKNAAYREFGWFSARSDDLFSYIPARLTAVLVALCSPLVRTAPWKTMRTILRDARKTSSPNAGFPMAAFAGALGVRLGGTTSYFGKKVNKPYIGEASSVWQEASITGSIRLVYGTTVLFLVLLVAMRVILGTL